MFLIGLVVAAAVIIKVESAEFIPASEVVPASSLLRPPQPEQVARAWRQVAAMDAAPVGGPGELGDAIRAALAAHRLNLIDGRELHRRVSGIIETGSRMDPTREAGSGDAARYVAALELVAWGGYPSLRAQAAAELLRRSAASDTPADQLMRAALLSTGERP
jgi:hypothetical protein